MIDFLDKSQLRKVAASFLQQFGKVATLLGLLDFLILNQQPEFARFVEQNSSA